MTDAPERIWLLWNDIRYPSRYAASSYNNEDEKCPEYIRADKVKALVEAASGYRRAVDAFDGTGSMTKKIAGVTAWRDAMDAALRDLDGGNG